MGKSEQELPQTEHVDLIEVPAQQFDALEEVQTANTLLRTLLETMPVGVGVCNAQGEMLMTNPHGRKILGESIGGSILHPRHNYTLHYPDGTALPPPENPLARAITQGEKIPWTEILLRRADGAERALLIAAAPVEDSTGQIISGVTIFQDITEQVQAREVLQNYAEELERQTKRRASALRASHARFRAIFEDAAIGIALVNQNAHVIAGNPALQRILGYSEEDLKGMSLAALTHPDNVGDDLKLYNELIAGERRYYQMEGRYVRKDGRPIYVNVTVSLVQWREASARFAIVMLEDISARKEAQEALIQSEKLALTGKLAASLAHEVNNPLQSVVGFLSLLEESLAGDGKTSKKEARGYVRIAIEEVKRAAHLVHEMRNLNQPSEPEDWKPSDVNDLVERVMALIHKKSQEQHVQITWEAADNLPLIPVVPDRIQQVFLNLTLNALEAMPDGGELHISTARTANPPGVEIHFADSGVGIAFADIGKLFKPFHTTKDAGMGLGLYISQSIVREHGGRIDVESVAGEGANFAVWLPA